DEGALPMAYSVELPAGGGAAAVSCAMAHGTSAAVAQAARRKETHAGRCIAVLPLVDPGPIMHADARITRAPYAARHAPVPAVRARRHHLAQSHRGLADVPVLGIRWVARALAPGAPGQPRGRRRGPGVHRGHRGVAGRAHLAGRHRYLGRGAAAG